MLREDPFAKYKISKDDMQIIQAACVDLTNARLMDDAPLSQIRYSHLNDLCDTMIGKYGKLPFFYEILADFSIDPCVKNLMYSIASKESKERRLPLHTIHISWAEFVIDSAGDYSYAEKILDECRCDLDDYGDDEDRDEFLRLKEIVLLKK